MKLSQSFLVLPLISNSAAPVEFPLVNDPISGLASLHVLIAGVTPENHLLPINFGRDTRFYATRNTGIRGSSFPMTLVGPSTSIPLSMNAFQSILWPWIGPTHSIGIGPSSPYIGDLDSITIIQNATSPVLLASGASQEYFESRCYENSVVVGRIDFATVPISLFAQVVFANEDLAYNFVDPPRVHFTTHGSSHTALVLGTDIYPRFRARMLERGSMNDHESNVFTNCTANLISDMTIHLKLIGRTSQDIHRIVIDGEDYMDHNPSDNTCRVLSSRGRSLFNPLKIPGINIRFVARCHGEEFRYMQFCDSSF